MKRILIIAALCLAALTANGQTIEVLGGSTTRIFIEKTSTTDNSMTYGYIEGAFNNSAYAQFIHEQKFWKLPLYIHGEYRTTFNGAHTAIAGASYSFGLPCGFISVGEYYRFDFGANLHSAQSSVCYLADFGWLELYGYNDFWYDGAPNFFGEERAHIKITEHFKLGAVVDLAYFGSFTATPYIGIRYDF